MASYSAIITSAEEIIAGGPIFKIAASHFFNVSEEQINLMKENAIPGSVSARPRHWGESRVAFRKGPRKNGERANLALNFRLHAGLT